MMRKLFSIAVMSICCIYTNLAIAGCDPCIQSAANTANSQMTSGLSSTTAAVNANVTATNTLNTTVQSVSAALQSTLSLHSQQYLSGLSASTNRIELSIQQNTKTITNLTDHFNNTMVNALKEMRIAEQVDENNKTFGQLAQPLSGDIGANRAPMLKEGIVQSRQIWRKITDDMHTWNNNTSDVNALGSAAKTSILLTEPDEVWDPSALVTKNQISIEESLNLQKLLTLIVNPVPQRAATKEELANDSRIAEKELNRRIDNSKLSLVHSVLANSVAKRHPLIPISGDDWQIGYTTSQPDNNGKTSYLSMLESETVGKLTSEGWYLDIKTKTVAGAMREQVYQSAIRNQMLMDLVEQEEQKNILLAIIAIEEITKSKPGVGSN